MVGGEGDTCARVWACVLVCIPRAWLPCRVSSWLCVMPMPVLECARWRKVLERLPIRCMHTYTHAYMSLRASRAPGPSFPALTGPSPGFLAAENFLLIVH